MFRSQNYIFMAPCCLSENILSCYLLRVKKYLKIAKYSESEEQISPMSKPKKASILDIRSNRKKVELPENKKREFDEDTILIFTDGACEGNPGPAGIGVFFQYRNYKKEISRFIGYGTNNIAELTAIKIALQEIKNPHLPVALFTDSSYCYGVLTGRLKAKKNHPLIEEIKKEMARFPRLKFFKVEGHAGIEGNEKANQLAQQSLLKLKDKKT